MRRLDIYQFTKFIVVWQSGQYNHLRGVECMQEFGFKSARFTPIDDTDQSWQLSDEEYTWFILRWS
jgi:hypothetical protein